MNGYIGQSANNGQNIYNNQTSQLNKPNYPNMGKEMIVSPFGGMRKTCSLESLQTMMQDLQKEQLEQVNGPGIPYHRHGTMRVSKNQPNESFRAAVDRSYEIKNYITGHSNIQPGMRLF